MNHTFVICAYKESPFLEETVQFLLAQTRKSNVLISTSTPNAHIDGVAKKYLLEVRVNPSGGTSAKDWNFAYAQAETEFVTLAHQDDIYEYSFAEKTLAAMENSKRPLAAWTDCYEIRHSADGEDGVRVDSNKLLRIKRAMQMPLGAFPNSRAVREFILALGYPVCCAGTTYNKKLFPEINFRADWQNSHDWEALARIAKEKGEFLFINEKLTGHRIYAESQTTKVIANGKRREEDFDMFKAAWPLPIARILISLYSKAYASNAL